MQPADADVHLVGRSAELVRLGALLDRARTGTTVVAVIDGPPGIGKSSLLHRFLRDLPSPDVTWVAGLAWERGRPGELVRRLLAAGPPRRITIPPIPWISAAG